ncbi:GntR family transcriptional regulator [Halovulum sp. GXIMD14794]
MKKPSMSRADAYHDFRDRLLSGELSPGQFVTQKELAELAGVPLGTAREAIQRLQHESLLKVHPQRGIQIVDVTTRFIRQAFGLRQALETYAVRVFAGGGFEAEIDALLGDTRAILNEAEGAHTPETLQRAVEIDWVMHDRIVDSTDNALLIETFQVNVARLRLIKVNNRLSPERALTALAEHIEILEFCRDGKVAEAVDAMSQHIDVATTRALQGI